MKELNLNDIKDVAGGGATKTNDKEKLSGESDATPCDCWCRDKSDACAQYGEASDPSICKARCTYTYGLTYCGCEH